MSTAPNCNKNAERARLRRAMFLKADKENAEWNKTLKTTKYPACIGKNLFEDCPKEVPDTKNPPSGCKACPQFTPTAEMWEERRKRMAELMASIRKTNAAK